MRFLLLLSILTLGLHAELILKSGEKQNVMIELFSSEGCSSCPPAEKWLNGFKHNPDLWKTYIPLAFHVDYWDRLGWKDPFAKSVYSKRQYAYKKQGHIAGVYTPGFLSNSQEWRGWFDSDHPQVATPYGGILSATIDIKDIRIHYQKKGDFRVHIALLGFGLKSKISRGENRGKLLEHDFVVLDMHSYFMQDSRLHTQLPCYFPKAPQYALAIWVTPADSMQVLQSIGGWLAR